MKRIYLFTLIVFSLIALPAKAQLSWGIKGGANISTLHISDLPETLAKSNITGFHIGPMIELMAPLFGLGFDASILYSKTGVEISNQEITTNYLDVPVNLKWKFGLPILKIYTAVGPYVGFRLGGEKVWTVINDQISSKSFSAGLNFGAGVELFRHLQVGVNYQLGLTENYSLENLNLSGKNRGWQLSAAILF